MPCYIMYEPSREYAGKIVKSFDGATYTVDDGGSLRRPKKQKPERVLSTSSNKTPPAERVEKQSRRAQKLADAKRARKADARAKKMERREFSTTARKIAVNRATMHARNLAAKEQ